MRRLRAVAAILTLAVIWLGYQVAHEIAAERARTSQQSAVDPVPPSARAKQRTKARAAAEVESPKAQRPKTFAQHTSGETLAPPQVMAPVVSAEDPAPAAQPVTLPVPSKDVPFFQSAFLDTQAGVLPGAGAGRRHGGMPSMSGGGGGGGVGGGMSGAASAKKNDETTGSGTGSPSVLGRRFSSESEESSTGGDSSNAGGNTGNTGSGGSGGSGGDGGSNSSNSSAKDSNQGGSNLGGSNQGGNNQGGNNQGGNNQGGSNEGDSNSSGGPGDTGKSGAPGGSGGDGGEQAIQAAFAPNVDGPNDGPKDLRSVPEPGSILLALGAAAAIVRRRMR
jgi:hypothetical protein